MSTKNYIGKCIGMALAICSQCFAVSPFVTVPWNGYSGAASFTFDDGLYQVEELPQILAEVPEAKVTFFLTNMKSMGVNLLHTYGAEFANFARMGHEIGNHSNSHVHLTSLNDDALKSEVIDFADEIKQVMASYGADVSITAHALPFSANSEKVSEVVEQRHFINRSSWGNGRHDWDKQPNWNDVDSRVWYTLPNADTELMKALDTAAFIGKYESPYPWIQPIKAPSWVVLLNHGVSNAGGDHIAPALLKEAMQHAVKNNMWVASFSTVGAYYRAHFVLDKAQANATDNGFCVSWELPHKDMPKSIPMKITLNSQITSAFQDPGKIVIEQNGNVIWPDENGVYTIEFTALNATIREASSIDAPKPSNKPESNTTSISKKGLANVSATGSSSRSAVYTLLDARGARLGAANGFEVPAHMPKGVYFIRAEIPGQRAQTRKIIH